MDIPCWFWIGQVRWPMQACIGTLLLATVFVACDTGTDVDERRGEDSFSSNSLPDYTLVSRDGSANVWSIENGWLIGRAHGEAVNAGLIRHNPDIADGRVEFETDHITNGGIRFRVQDADTYYLLSVRDDEAPYYNMQLRNYELYRFHDGDWTSLAEYDLDIPRGERLTAGVEFRGGTFSLYLNGRLVGVVQDAMIQGAGSIGLEHDDRLTPGEESHYDVFRWESLD